MSNINVPTTPAADTPDLATWCGALRSLIAEHGRPIVSTEDPRYEALREVIGNRVIPRDIDAETGSLIAGVDYVYRVHGVPPAPIPAPTWSNGVQVLGNDVENAIVGYWSDPVTVGAVTVTLERSTWVDIEACVHDGYGKPDFVQIKTTDENTEMTLYAGELEDLIAALQAIAARVNA